MEAPQGNITGELGNISLGGALFISPVPLELSVGTGVEVSFRLPAGLSVRTPAIVRWRRPHGPSGELHVGLEFASLSPTNRSFLESYVDSVCAVTETERPTVGARVVTKYAVGWDEAGRLNITLAGLICRNEARAVADLVRESVARPPDGPLRFQLDVRSLSVCSQEVTVELRGCFDALRDKGEVFGLLVGERSLAHTQVMRSVREMGFADAIFCADDLTQASEIWRQMES
jgi:hypothetical protein